MPLTRLVLDQTDHAESSASGTLVSDCELINVSGFLQIQIPDVLTDLDDVIITSPIIDEVLQFNGTNWENASVSGVGGGGNTLDQAYDEGGAGVGRIIAADAGAVQIDALLLTVKIGGGGLPIDVENDGTQNGIFINQDGNGVALGIDSEATSNPLINLAPLNTNTRGDIAFSTARTADPSSPAEGDIWYNTTSNNLLLFDGAGTVDLTAGAGGGNTLDAAYDQGGAGAGRIITADAGAVQIDGSNQLALDINQAGNFGCLELDKNGLGIGTVLDINNDGTGQAININQQGANDAIFIKQDGNGVPICIDNGATSQPSIVMVPLNSNTRGDISFGVARTSDPSTPLEGDFWYQATDEFIRYQDSAKTVSLTGIGRKSILVEDPTSSEDLTMWFTEEAVTVRQVEAVLRGSSTPSVTISVMHNTDRNAAGNNVLTAATAITSTTTGDSPAIGGDVTIPANSFVWLETSAQSGTVDELNVTIKFTED